MTKKPSVKKFSKPYFERNYLTTLNNVDSLIKYGCRDTVNNHGICGVRSNAQVNKR